MSWRVKQRSIIAISMALFFIMSALATVPVYGEGTGTSGGLTVDFTAVRTSPQDTLLQFDFSNGMDENLEATLGLIRVYDKSGGNVVNYSDYKYIKEGNKDTGGKMRRLELYFNNLEPGTEYVAELGAAIKANNGSTLGANKTLEFKTAVKEQSKDSTVEPLPEPVKPVPGLTDIQGHWAQKSIEQLVAMGAINGYGDGTFAPDKGITRAEFVTVLVKAFKLESESGKTFADTANHWAKQDIAIATAWGIINGYGDDVFGPDDSITREQMAIMVVKAAKLPPATGSAEFADSSSISAWAADAIAAACQNQLISGYEDNTYRPQRGTSRAEAVTVILNSLQKAA